MTTGYDPEPLPAIWTGEFLFQQKVEREKYSTFGSMRRSGISRLPKNGLLSEGKDWEPYWKDKDTKLVHFIGKDNIVFHCIIFPAMLKAQGDYILPDNVPANEFLNLEGNKLSTSKNWAVWLHEYLEEFPDKQDVLRYALTASAPETKDNDFTWKDFQAQ